MTAATLAGDGYRSPTWPGSPPSDCAPGSCGPALSALGIAIGVAAIVAVLGLSASSQAGLLDEINQLGTNLLTVSNGQSFTGGTAELPTTAPAMIGRISGVQQVQSTGTVSGANAYRTPYIPSVDTNALTVQAASLDLLPVVATTVAQGHYLNAATAQEPVAVLGAAAAQRLGIDRIYPGERHLGRRPMVLRRRHPQTGRARLRHRLLRPGRLPRGREVPRLRRPPLHHLPPRPDRPGQRRRQPPRRHRQPGEPQRGQRQPTLLRPRRPSRRQERPQRPVPRPRRRRPPGRRGRRRQHHDHLRPRTPLRDRPAPRARRHQRPHPHPVPLRSRPARAPRRQPSASPSAPPPPPSTPTPNTGPPSSPPKPGPAASPRPSSSAPSPGSSPPYAPHASHPPKPCGPSRPPTRCTRSMLSDHPAPGSGT